MEENGDILTVYQERGISEISSRISKRDLDALSLEYIRKCTHVRWRRKDQLLFYFNPITTLLSTLIICTCIIYCIVRPEQSSSSLEDVVIWITEVWTWLYVGTKDVWACFVIYLFFSKYSNLKLGRDEEQPEYPDWSYFTMLFSCGVGIGYFYYGVAEPIVHYRKTRNRYWDRHTDNVQAQDAINLTLFHWGIHGWIVYVIIGLLLGFLCYRRGLPMTMRTLFYPILGNKIFGVFGDLIDTVCIVCTMFGVCTSLVFGALHINTGLHSIISTIPVNMGSQIIIIWCLTLLATLSVVTGIKLGIRTLSEVCFGMGSLLLIIVFFADNTWYILNLLVQSVGYYFQWIVQLGFHTDAFTQLSTAPPDGQESEGWMNDWTIFYWGWWISWSPFVGMFIAKISRGRTIREFITFTLVLPCAYSFLWFTVFGGSAIRMNNIAENSNISCQLYNTSRPYQSKKYSSRALEIFGEYGGNRLECLSSAEMWFVFIRSYGPDTELFMSVISIAVIMLYFVTSSDSGSLVIDCISANGFRNPPMIQRIFWALTEGVCATALLAAGGTSSLKALQKVAVISGLPFTFLLNWTYVSLWRLLREEAGEIRIAEGQWDSSVWDIDSGRKVKTILISIPCPWMILTRVRMKLKKKRDTGTQICNTLFYAVPFYIWILLLICSGGANSGLAHIGWAVLLYFFAFASRLRTEIRELYGIGGNALEDFFSFLLLYPLTCMQISEQLLYGSPPGERETTSFTSRIETDERNILDSENEDHAV